MNLAKRAGLYTIRQKQKSMLLFLVLIFVSTLVLTGISIVSAVNDTFTDMNRDIAGTITLKRNQPEMDHEAIINAFDEGGQVAASQVMIEQFNSGDFVTFDALEAMMAVSGVNGYNLTAEFQMREANPENFAFLSNNEFSLVNEHGEPEPTTLANIQSATYSERMIGFLNGNLRLVSGRHLKVDDYRKVMISDDLAEHNDLQIGDVLKISGAPTFMGDNVSSRTLEFEIIGIYSGTRALEKNEVPESGHITDPIVLDADTLIIDMSTLLEEYARSNYFGTGAVGSLPGSVSIFIEDPYEIENVYDEITNLTEIYGKDFTLTMGSDGLEDVLYSLTSLRVLVGMLLVIIALVSMAILAILLTIWTRGRVKEIGIYLANGIKKGEILVQFILEASLIAAIAFGLSLPISQVTAEKAGDYIMNQFATAVALRNEQLESSTSIDLSQGGIVLAMPEAGFMTVANLENTLEMVDVGVSGHDLMWVYMIGLPVLIGSILIASYQVVILKPKEILSKMS